ncbi:MAG: hypothetical protein IT441_00170 [Phycisphaeraceae bacterium]|nr:hypothetical protein [Phycisphaeraceae bacterium]
MPCLLTILALIFPRLTILLVWLSSDYFSRAYQTVLWPVLGFFFMPLTMLAYALAKNKAGAVDGWYLVLVVAAVLIDLGILGGSGAAKHSGKR